MHNMCYHPIIRENGFSLGIVLEGEPGYYPTNYETVKTYDEAIDWANRCNDNMGLSEERTMEIVMSSMAAQFGRKKK